MPPSVLLLTHLPLNNLSGFNLYALDAYDSDPLPLHLVARLVIEQAISQLSRLDLDGLNGQGCLEQEYHWFRTYGWTMESDMHKFTCEGCTMTLGRVCMRGLGGTVSLILPEVPRFREFDSITGSGVLSWDR